MADLVLGSHPRPREREKAPAYQWYVKDYETDEAVKLMTYEQEGIYRRLLDHQWLHGGIPADPKQIARLVPKVPQTRFLRLWPALSEKFSPRADGRLVNARLERQRAEQDEYQQSRATNGRKGAARRWGLQIDGIANGSAIDSPQANPIANHGSSSATASAEEPSLLPEPFEVFWEAYPRKVGKDDARRAFSKRRLGRGDLPVLLGAIAAQRPSRQWVEGFIPNPATWLNQGRWQDEPEPHPKGSAGVRRPQGCRHTPPCPDDDAHRTRYFREQNER